MKHALIFGNGEIKNYNRIKNIFIESLRPGSGKRFFPEHFADRPGVDGQQKRKPSTSSGKKDFIDLIICADGGAKHAVKLGLIPNAVIGDMDSITPLVRKKLEKNPDIKWIEHPAEKDATDSQLAIDYAVTQGCNSVTLIGFTGGRTDHFLSTLFYLASLRLQHVEILSDSEIMYIVRNIFVLKGLPAQSGRVDQLFSLIPLFGDVKDITLTGVKYGLKNETLKLGSTRGVSNVMIGGTTKITYSDSNPLLVIFQDA